MRDKLFTITLVLFLSLPSYGRENAEYFDTKNDPSFDCKNEERIKALNK